MDLRTRSYSLVAVVFAVVFGVRTVAVVIFEAEASFVAFGHPTSVVIENVEMRKDLKLAIRKINSIYIRDDGECFRNHRWILV